MKTIALALLLTLLPLQAGACIKKNNPGNLVKTGVLWEGQTKSKGRFIAFKDAHHGLRALCIVLLRYEMRHRLDTVHEVVTRFAPPHENHTQKYANYVAKEVGIGVHEEMSVKFYLPLLMKAIVYMENGTQPYTDDQIYLAVMDGLEYVRNNP